MHYPNVDGFPIGEFVMSDLYDKCILIPPDGNILNVIEYFPREKCSYSIVVSTADDLRITLSEIPFLMLRVSPISRIAFKCEVGVENRTIAYKDLFFELSCPSYKKLLGLDLDVSDKELLRKYLPLAEVAYESGCLYKSLLGLL